ncbi:DUF2586 domain-containing protein [Oceanobacter sp. 4_MG-2023]|uniref:DUF2586 domain-containing protein n=1 Tax=Oceanobacter sp. 4_MG-2023 TaxID=3062623 RepID=UPI0027343B44|nr:DUF2586 domain-containing protein [Oceanobacter sp. 4_MG-2023]MDP2548895.1 DUF2586 domain-containing protein [Oceanobacter sp. 4_MG-2023]
MALGTISANQQNLSQGATTDVERRVLWIGYNDENADDAVTVTNAATVHTIGASTDLDAILGAADSNLKTQITAAQQNVGPNWTAYVVPLYSALGGSDIGTAFGDWSAALEIALGQPNNIKTELVALTDNVTATDLPDLQAACTNAINTWAKYITIHAPLPGPDGSQTWAQYITATKAINGTDVFDRVHLVPQLHGTNLGAVIGRLTSEYVSIADSPMRVQTGTVAGLGEHPEDSTGIALDLDHLSELSEARFSVPQWYPDKDGTYWADHMSLDASDGDFSVYENRRVIDYITRRIRLLMINQVANRAFNSSASSTAYYTEYFLKPIYDAAKASTINGEPAAGLVQTPVDGDMVITWLTNTSVELAAQAAPKNSAKKLGLYISLDLTRTEA